MLKIFEVIEETFAAKVLDEEVAVNMSVRRDGKHLVIAGLYYIGFAAGVVVTRTWGGIAPLVLAMISLAASLNYVAKYFRERNIYTDSEGPPCSDI